MVNCDGVHLSDRNSGNLLTTCGIGCMINKLNKINMEGEWRMEKTLDQAAVFGVNAYSLKRSVFKQLTVLNPMKHWPRPTTEDGAFGTIVGWVNNEDGRLDGFITRMPDNTLAYIYYDHLVETLMWFIRQDEPNRPFSKMQEEAKATVNKHQKRTLQVFVS